MEMTAFILLSCMAVPVCHVAEWYPGIIQLYITFPDGAMSPAVLAGHLRASDAKFMVVTDHYDQIGRALKTSTPFSLSLADIALNRGGPWGFAKVLRRGLPRGQHDVLQP